MGNSASTALLASDHDDPYGFHACTEATAQLLISNDHTENDKNDSRRRSSAATARSHQHATHHYPGQRHTSICDHLQDFIADDNRYQRKRSLSLPSSSTNSAVYDLRLSTFLETCLQLKIRSIVADAVKQQAEMEVWEEMEKHAIVLGKLGELDGMFAELKERRERVRSLGAGGRSMGRKDSGRGGVVAWGLSQWSRRRSEDANAKHEASGVPGPTLLGPKPSHPLSPESQANISDFRESILDREADMHLQPIGLSIDLGTPINSPPITANQIFQLQEFVALIRRLEQASKLSPQQLRERLLEVILEAEDEVKILQRELNEIRSDLEFGLLRMSWQVSGSGTMEKALKSLCDGVLEQRGEEWGRLVEVARLESKYLDQERDEVDDGEANAEQEERRESEKGSASKQWFRFDSLFGH